MANSTTPVILALLALVAVPIYLLRPHRRRFPGPPGLPLLGNVHQLPKTEMWLDFSRWQNQYGGKAVQFNVLRAPVVVIHSRELIQDLLEKRAHIYSDRSKLVMAGELAGMDRTFSMQDYNDPRWRTQRRMVAPEFAPAKLSTYYRLQEGQARILVNNLMAKPEELEWQLKVQIGVIIIRVLYGYHVQSHDDPFLRTPLKHLEYFGEGTLPGAFLVDTFPQLKYLPQWFPGAGFHKKAHIWRDAMNNACWKPYLWSKDNLETGKTLMPNLFGPFLQDGLLTENEEAELVWAAYSVLVGGLDTNICVAMAFYLAMVMTPEVQRRAQSEIDVVVGTDRLPTVEDKEELPYIRSVMTEIFRWHTPGPLGFPRSTAEDDEYDGIFVEKGTTIFINVWHMLNDPKLYPEPEKFNPDRYNNSDAEMKKVFDLNFGFGRRACVGQNFAMGTLYSIIMITLATCDVVPALDDHGKEIPIEHGWTSTIISFPKAFNMRLKPRSEKAYKLLQEAVIAFERPEI